MNAIIFDFDGTLADSLDEILAFLCAEAGRDPASITAEERLHLQQLPMREVALRVGVPAWRLPFTYFRGKKKLARRMHVVQPFAGIPELLRDLHAEQYKLLIVSSNNRRNIQRFLVQHGLGNYFSGVYGSAGLVAKWRVIKRALTRHDLQASTTVYVGDEVRDIIAAKLAGMPSIAVTWGFGSEAQLLTFGPTLVVRTPAQLQKALVDWGKTGS